MSKPPPAPGISSPAPSVRSSDAYSTFQYADSPPPPQSKKVIPPVGKQRTLPSTKIKTGLEIQLSWDQLGQSSHDNGALLDSAATTPRLPPVSNGSDGWHLMSSPDLESLDSGHASFQPNRSPSLKSANSRSSLTPSPHRGSLVTSFSEVTLNNPGNISNDLQHGMLASDKEAILERISPQAARKYRSANSSRPPLYSTRTRSQGAMTDIEMVKTFEKEEAATDNDILGRERPPQQKDGTRSIDRRNRSSSRSGKVEKRIEATLAKAEPSSSARSRKSSHLLGLFKENAAHEDQKPLEKVKSPSTSRIASERDVKELISDVIDEETAVSGGKLPQKQAELAGKEEALQEHFGLERSSDHAIYRAEKRRKEEEKPKLIQKILPSDLLVQIREHKLAIPVRAGSTSAHPKLPPKIASFGIDTRAVNEDAGGKQALDKFSSPSAVEGEDESDKEEISSALYYPHQAPSPEAFDDLDEDRPTAIHDFDLPNVKRPSPQLSPTIDDEEIPSEEVDIALQSQDKQRYLHGDLLKSQSSSDEVPSLDSGLSSASESDNESLGESGRSASGDEQVDLETTPRASPKPYPSFLRPKPRNGLVRPAAPFGAVELKPYTHQVGGHSTVYKFSKRAVCKPLSNRENEFYEVIERQHPELLKFLPRYEYDLVHQPSGERQKLRQNKLLPFATPGQNP